MFKIIKIFENSSTLIYKLERETNDNNLSSWAEELEKIVNNSNDHHVIFEGCEISYMNPNSVKILIKRLKNKVFFMNLPNYIKNMIVHAGYKAHLLD